MLGINSIGRNSYKPVENIAWSSFIMMKYSILRNR